MRPFFTIIIPTHRRAQLLGMSIDSLRAQSFGDFELIVVSDCADEETFRVASSKLNDLDVFIKRKGPRGPAESRNSALDSASGEYVIFLDDDDTLAPSYLEQLHAECEKNPRSVLYCNYQVVFENRDTFPATFVREQACSIASIPLSQLYVKNFIPPIVVAYPRRTLENKRFDRHLMYEDWDFLLNVAQDAEFHHHDIGGPIKHEDESPNQIQRCTESNRYLVMDYIYIYRKWPGRTEDIKLQRQQLMMTVGLQFPTEWL